MTPTEFFRHVLPRLENEDERYCVAGFKGDIKEHRFVDTVSAMSEVASDFERAGRDVYFALSSFSREGKRTAAAASKVGCFFIDVDVGETKHYRSVEDAAQALEEWRKSSEFPRPLVVFSGGGIHAYWPFVDSVSVAEWKPYAEALTRAAKGYGFEIDFSVSTDAARILRVPETSSHKYQPPKKVSILDARGQRTPFTNLARLLEPHKTKPTPPRPKSSAKVGDVFDSVLDAAPQFAVGKASFNTKVLEATEKRFENIVALGDKGCASINKYLEEASADGMEPLWRATISIAKYCVEGEPKAYELAAMHPYDENRTAKKLAEISGPYGCGAFEKINPHICGKCPHKGKISSPIMLGVDVKPVEAPPEQVEVKVGNFVQQHEYPEPHNNFSLSHLGVAYKYTEDGIPRVALLTDVPIYASATYERAGERWAQFIYVEHGETKNAVLPMSVATAREESLKAFAKIGILINNGYENQFRAYIKSSLAQARKKPPLHMPTSLGWQDDNSFAFDNRLFYSAEERVVPMFGFENINEATGCKGSLDVWRHIAQRVVLLERPDIAAMMLIGFAAPLMKFTGLNGVTFHLCGNDSGRGKTLCQRLASSVWGHPDKFRITPNTSPVAMINRMGMLGNLPLFVDEVTHRGRNDAEWFPEFLSQMSDGRGKERMESQANAERRNSTSWASIALMTSNKHMMDYLTAERAHGSEGEIRRLLEIVFDKKLDLDLESRRLFFEVLPENYGVAGEAYARYLVQNAGHVQDTVRTLYTNVFDKFGATGDERFWIAGCACIIAACKLVKQAGIFNPDPVAITDFLEKLVRDTREDVKQAKRTAIDVLNAFTKRNFGKIVVVNGKIASISGVEVAETLDRQDLCGRVEKRHDGYIDYYIEERELKAFCSSLSYGYNEFRRDLAAYSPIKRVQKDVLAGTRGPMMMVNCLHLKQKTAGLESLFDKAANE